MLTCNVCTLYCTSTKPWLVGRNTVVWRLILLFKLDTTSCTLVVGVQYLYIYIHPFLFPVGWYVGLVASFKRKFLMNFFPFWIFTTANIFLKNDSFEFNFYSTNKTTKCAIHLYSAPPSQYVVWPLFAATICGTVYAK